MQKPQQLIIICGPTASGKTALALDVAKEFDGEVVSADSMQVYRGMDIGTAKPTAEEMRGVPHHMLDCTGPGEEFSAAIYREQARGCIADIAARGRLPILCGGTGLFISAVVYPLDFNNSGVDELYRRELNAYAEQYGNDALHAKLNEVDPDAATAIHPNNVRRVVRALEKNRSSGSTINANQDGGRQQLFNGDPLYDVAWVGLSMERETLYRRIEERVDIMMRQGLLDEVSRASGLYGKDSTAMQGLGYKELLVYLDGATTLEKAVEQIKTGTRNYAKRQLTWFKREKNIKWFDIGDYDSRKALDEAVYGYIKSSLHMS